MAGLNFSKLQRITVNAPPEVKEMFESRADELPLRYKSLSDYFLAVALKDCIQRKPHSVMPKILNQLPAARDAALAKIVADFKAGRYEGDELPIEDAMLQLLVERLSHLPARVRKIKANSSKPSARRR